MDASVAVGVIEHLLAVVGEVDDHGVACAAAVEYLSHDTVVVADGVVVVGDDAAFVAASPQPRGRIFGDAVGREVTRFGGEAVAVGHVLAHQVEDREPVRIAEAKVLSVEIGEQSFVERVFVGVAMREELRGEPGMVEEMAYLLIPHVVVFEREGRLVVEHQRIVTRTPEESGE